MIRTATASDKDAVLLLIKEFSEIKTIGIKFDTEKVSKITNTCIDSDTVLVLEVEGKIVGAACGMLFKSLMSEEIIYQDIYFYIQKPYLNYTKSMLHKIEEKCKEMGVDKISMATMGDNPRLDKLYELLGYKILEKHFSKEIVNA